jgi:hypothetical protein
MLKLSVLVVVYRMPRQAENTIFTLSTAYQRDITEEEYEIVVVENRSDQCLDPDRLRQIAPNARYFLRDEAGVSPAAAVNFGFAQCRASIVGLMIDGARMVTPRVLRWVLRAFFAFEKPLVATPGYHLGPDRQWKSRYTGYDEQAEQALLSTVDWRRDGYSLFDIACIDDTNNEGFFSPFIESNCFFFRRKCFLDIGGADERFQTPGGGILNLAIFNHMCRLPRTKFVVLLGEGSFHQYHGGVSTSGLEDREAMLEVFREEYRTLYGHRIEGYDREPVIFGAVSPHLLPHLNWSAEQGGFREIMIHQMQRVEWPND